MVDIMDFADEFKRIIDGEDFIHRNFINTDTKFTTYPSSKHLTDTGYAFVVPVPGLSKEHIKISVIDGGKAFKIEGSIPTEPHIASGLWKFSPTSTIFKIPHNADPDTIKAKVEYGLLKIVIDFRKNPEPKVRIIQIE
jgi:HSP20 family molecular chaperone IbpA